MPIYVCAADGRIVFFNRAAAELWGRKPDLTKEFWCGAHRTVDVVQDTEIEKNTCPMATAIELDIAMRNEPLTVVRPDGSKTHVFANPTVVHGKDGAMIGAINVLIEVADVETRKFWTEENHNRLAMMVRSAAESEVHESRADWNYDAPKDGGIIRHQWNPLPLIAAILALAGWAGLAFTASERFF